MQNSNIEIILSIISGILLFCFCLWILWKFFIKPLKLLTALWEANKEAKAERLVTQLNLKRISTRELRQSLLNHSYFSQLKDTKKLKTLITTIKLGEEAKIVPRLSQSKMYYLLAAAEHELGWRGRPEAVDYSSEIWDILTELAVR